jgi:hypothetical protein
MRSKRYTPKKLPNARRALGLMAEGTATLKRASFNLRMAGDARAATGIEQALLRIESWSGKVSESIALSDPGGRQPISADEPGMRGVADE